MRQTSREKRGRERKGDMEGGEMWREGETEKKRERE